jgi:Fe-S cluster biogenesis protein NfuA
VTVDGDPDLRAAGDRIEQLLDQLATIAPRPAVATVEEVLGLVTDLYGGALQRVVALVGATDPALLDRLAADDLVASLLLVHDLHPDSLAARVAAALERVRPLLARHGGDVELVEVDDASRTVQLRLLGSCDGCPSSSATLREAIERAIGDAAPEVAAVQVRRPGPVPAPAAGGGTGPVPVPLVAKPARAYDACPAEVSTG